MFEPLEYGSVRRITLKLGAAGIAGGLLEAIAAGSGFPRSLYPPLIGHLWRSASSFREPSISCHRRQKHIFAP